MVKAICFSPEKTAPLTKAMETKSPIKIKKYEYNDKFKNIVIKNNTSITDSQESFAFTPPTSLQGKIQTIDSLNSTTPQQLVTLKATVKNVPGPKTVKIEKGTLAKLSATLVDPSGSIHAVFWEEWVNFVEVNKTYVFTNLRMRKDNYTGELYVDTAKQGFKLEQAPDVAEELPDAQPTLLDMATKDVDIHHHWCQNNILLLYMQCMW